MLYIRIKSFLIITFFALGIGLAFQSGLSTAWPLFAGAFVLFLTNILFGTVWPALRVLKKGQLKDAAVLLKMTRFPEWLMPWHKAYFHFIRGMIAMQSKQVDEGQKHLILALDKGLKTDTDRALTALNLAHSFFLKNNFATAEKYFKIAKSCNSNDLMIQENLEKLELALANALKHKQS